MGIVSLLSVFKSPKLIGVLLLIVGLGFGAKSIWDKRYNEGYNAAKLQESEKYQAALTKQMTAYEKEVQKINAKQQAVHERELARVKQESATEKEVDKVIEYVTVEKPILVPAECNDVSNAINSMRNKAYNIINSSTSPSEKTQITDTTRFTDLLQTVNRVQL